MFLNLYKKGDRNYNNSKKYGIVYVLKLSDKGVNTHETKHHQTHPWPTDGYRDAIRVGYSGLCN